MNAVVEEMFLLHLSLSRDHVTRSEKWPYPACLHSSQRLKHDVTITRMCCVVTERERKNCNLLATMLFPLAHENERSVSDSANIGWLRWIVRCKRSWKSRRLRIERLKPSPNVQLGGTLYLVKFEGVVPL